MSENENNWELDNSELEFFKEHLGEDVVNKYKDNRAKLSGLMVEKIKKEIEENMCHKEKKVGDWVKVWDGSYSEDLYTGENYPGNDKISNYPLILIEVDCENPLIIHPGTKFEEVINRDVVVYSPKYRRKIATCMEFLKLVEPEEDSK